MGWSRFRSFSLRTLLVLVTCLCLWMSWTRAHVLERRAAIAYWNTSIIVWRHADSSGEPSDPPDVWWFRRCFGDRAVSRVSISTENDQEVFDTAKRLFPEAKVQWAMITMHHGMLETFPLPSRNHWVYLSSSGPVLIEPEILLPANNSQ